VLADDTCQDGHETKQDAGAKDVHKSTHAMPEHGGQGAENAYGKGEQQHDGELVAQADVMILLRDIDGEEDKQRRSGHTRGDGHPGSPVDGQVLVPGVDHGGDH
jgi:hypothetical protein